MKRHIVFAKELYVLNIVRLPEGTVEKWLAKAGVDLFEDMPADAIAKCIAYVQNRLQAGATVAA